MSDRTLFNTIYNPQLIASSVPIISLVLTISKISGDVAYSEGSAVYETGSGLSSNAHTDLVTSVSYDYEGYLASSSLDTIIIIWDLSTQSQVKSFQQMLQFGRLISTW